MPEPSRRDGPPLQVTLELDHAIDRALGTGRDRLGALLARRLDELMATLGVPGRAEVTVADPVKAPALGPWLRLTVGGRRRRYPDELLWRAAEVVRGRHMATGSSLEALLAGLAEPPGGADALAEALGLACLEAVRLHPARLLGPAQAAAYAEALGGRPGTAWPAERLAPVLAHVLELRVSIADHERVGAVLAGADGGLDAGEELVATLRPEALEVRLPAAYLGELTRAAPAAQAGLFSFMREGLYVELGIPLPAFAFVPDEGLAPHGIAFTVNHLPTLPFLGLPPGRGLVNDLAERLGPEATAATNPTTGYPGAIVDQDRLPALEEDGVTTWDPLQYLVLVLAGVVRRHAGCLVDQGVVMNHLDVLDAAFPDLVRTARPFLPFGPLTRLLRMLVAEQVSIRNLRLIVERSLDWASPFGAPPRPAGASALDGDPAGLLAFVRAGLRQQLSDQYGRGTGPVVAYLLDQDIEGRLTRSPAADEADVDLVAAAVRAELAELPPTAMRPAVLTTAAARAAVRAAVGDEFPRLGVLSHDDLAPERYVQPVARISLAS
jgi:FHIPEP family